MSAASSAQPDAPPPWRGERPGLAVADAAVSMLFLLLGLYLAGASVIKYQAFTQGQVGPGVLPFLIGVTMVLTSGLVMLRLRRSPEPSDAEAPTGPELLRVLKLLALMIACVAVIPLIGALVALGLFVLIETAIIEQRGWRLSLVTAVAIPLALYVFFEVLLGVPLPAGRIGLI